jgi:hypothetical protein
VTMRAGSLSLRGSLSRRLISLRLRWFNFSAVAQLIELSGGLKKLRCRTPPAAGQTPRPRNDTVRRSCSEKEHIRDESFHIDKPAPYELQTTIVK